MSSISSTTTRPSSGRVDPSAVTFAKVLVSTRAAILFDRELVLTKVGDRLIVAIERDQIELDEIGVGRRGGTLCRRRCGKQRDENEGGEPPHTAAFRMTAIAVAVTP